MSSASQQSVDLGSHNFIFCTVSIAFFSWSRSMYMSDILCDCCRMVELAGSAADALLPLLFCEQELYQVHYFFLSNWLTVIRSLQYWGLVFVICCVFLCRDWSMSCLRNSRTRLWNQGWQLLFIILQVLTISQARLTGQTGRNSGKISVLSWARSQASCR